MGFSAGAVALPFLDVALEEEGGACPADEGEVAAQLTELVADALHRLLQSRWGSRHEVLRPTPEDATMALLGYPPDERPGWAALAAVLRGMVLNDLGEVLGCC